jgi:hypothetical protein
MSSPYIHQLCMPTCNHENLQQTMSGLATNPVRPYNIELYHHTKIQLIFIAYFPRILLYVCGLLYRQLTYVHDLFIGQLTYVHDCYQCNQCTLKKNSSLRFPYGCHSVLIVQSCSPTFEGVPTSENLSSEIPCLQHCLLF